MRRERLYRNVIVMPIESFHDGAMFRGGPLWPRYAWQWKARHARGWLPFPRDAAPSRVSEPELTLPRAIWCGPIAFHFGHAVADFGMRIAESAHSGMDCPLLFAMQRDIGADPPEYFWQMLKHLKVPPHRVVITRSPVLVSELYVFPQSEIRGGPGPSRRHLDMMDRITGRASTEGSDRKIYVSRSRLDKNHNCPVGQIAAESYLEDALVRTGFTIVYPEEIPLDQQLAAYQSSSTLIFSEGSALHGLQLLGRIDANLGIIGRRKRSAMAPTAFRRRVTRFAYIRAVHGMIYRLRPNGRADKIRAISVLDENKLLSSLSEFGVDLAKIWNSNDYATRRDADITSWTLRTSSLEQHPSSKIFVRKQIKKLIGKPAADAVEH